MKGLKERAKELKTDVPALFLALKEKRTPLLAKLLAAVVVIYALSPVDLIPDFIPVLGCLDDLLVLPALTACCIRLIPAEVFASCRNRARDMAQRPAKWYYAIPFVLIWLGLIALMVTAFL